MLPFCKEPVKFSSWKIVVFQVMILPCIMFAQDPNPSWQVFALGEPPLLLRLPGLPIPLETQIQPSMLEIIMAFYAYEYQDIDKGIVVMLVQNSYAHQIHPDFTIISDQTIRELESHGALNIKYKTTSIEIDGKKGIRQNGTLVSKGELMDFTATILKEVSNVWKVVIYSRVGDPDAKQTAQSIMNSMTFKQQ